MKLTLYDIDDNRDDGNGITYWSKAAKPVFDSAGRLIPWDGK